MIVSSKFVGKVVPAKVLGTGIVAKYVRIVYFISETIKQITYFEEMVAIDKLEIVSSFLKNDNHLKSE